MTRSASCAARMKDFIDNVGDEGRARARAPRRARATTRTPACRSSSTRRPRPGASTPRVASPAPATSATRRATGPIADLQGRGQGPRAVGARPSGGDRRRRPAVHGLRVPERDHRPLGVRLGRGRVGDDAGLDHAAPLRQPRAARALPGSAGGRRAVPVGRADRARGRRQRPDADADHRLPRRRRVGDQRPQVVHVGRVARRVHHGVREDRAGRRQAHAVQLDHRPDRHARLPDPAGGAHDGPRRRPALRGRLRQRARAA